MFFKGYIRNTTQNMWLSREKDGDISHVLERNEALVFHDFEDALQSVEYLNDALPDCFTLVQDDENTLKVTETLKDFQIPDAHIGRIIETLNEICPYEEVTAEKIRKKRGNSVFILIRCYEDKIEIQQYLFQTDGLLLADQEIA